MTGSGVWANFLNNAAMPVSKIIEGTGGVFSAIYSADATQANIEATKVDALLEILRQAQDQYTKGSTSLQEFINKVLNVMMQLIQAAAQAEISAARSA